MADDQYQVGEPEPMEKLYNVVKDRGLYTKTFGEFKSKYSDSTSMSKLFDVVAEQGLYTKSREEFFSKYSSSKKKEVGGFGSLPTPYKLQSPVEANTLGVPESFPGGKTPASISGNIEHVDRLFRAGQRFNKHLETAIPTLAKELDSNDDVAGRVIREQKFNIAGRDINESIGGKMQSDNTSVASMQNIQPRQEVSGQTSSTEEVAKFKEQTAADPLLQRKYLKQITSAKPEKKAEIGAALYALDAKNGERVGDNKIEKIQDNVEKIKSGELEYDERGTLTKPEGFLSSVLTGLHQRTEQMRDYKVFNEATDEELINIIKERELAYDADDPVPVPKGRFGNFATMLGNESVQISKGVASSFIPGGALVKIGTALAATTPEAYKRQYATTIIQSYKELTDQGMEPMEAIKIARSQAKDEAQLAVVETAASTIFGMRAGFRKIPITNPKNAENVLKGISKFMGEGAKDAIPDAAIAGYLQRLKNDLAIEKGIGRDADEGVIDNIKGELMFAGMTAATMQAGKAALSAKTFAENLFHVSKYPKDVTDATLDQLVESGQITPEQAEEGKNNIQKQRDTNAKIPEGVTDEAHLKIQDKIIKRENIEEKIESIDKAFHPDLKEQVKKINEDIIELSNDKDEGHKEDKKLISLINKSVTNGDVRGLFSDMAKDAIKMPGGANEFMKSVADQALNKVAPEATSDAENMRMARESFGDEIVDRAIEMFPKEQPKGNTSNVGGEVEVGAKPKPIDEQSIETSQKWIKDLYSLPDLTRIQDKNGNVYDIKNSKLRKLTLDKEGNVVDAETIHTDRDIHKKEGYLNPDFFNEGYKILPEQSLKETPTSPKAEDTGASAKQKAADLEVERDITDEEVVGLGVKEAGVDAVKLKRKVSAKVVNVDGELVDSRVRPDKHIKRMKSLHEALKQLVNCI